MLTGHRSGGIVAIDVDKGGEAYLEALEKKYGVLPATRLIRTPSDGYHLYYRTRELIRTQAPMTIPGSTCLGGVDLRGEGGIVVIPPTPGYVVDEDLPIAEFPAAWLAVLPRARHAADPVYVESVHVGQEDLRRRLAETAQGRRGDPWESLRLIARGEQALVIGTLDGTAPHVSGVDSYLSTEVIFQLACAQHDDFAWFKVDASDIATLFEPSMSRLRADVASLGGQSKWDRDHVAQKWERAAAKAAGQVQELIDLSLSREADSEASAEIGASGTPLIVRVDDAFFVLDDRARLRYEGPCTGGGLHSLCKKLWPGRILQIPAKSGMMRDMTPPEILAVSHGEACNRIEVDYTATGPRVDDLTLIRSLESTPVAPLEDTEVAEWLDLLGGDRLRDWLAWAAPEKCLGVLPALTIIRGSHIGKTLLAESLAQAVGQRKATALKDVLGARFRTPLERGPIVFGDEGLPEDHRGRPLTAELRAMLTESLHEIEMKGLNKRTFVRGGVRCILAANAMDRVFSNTGSLGGHDITAITRRLFVIEIDDPGLIRDLRERAIGLGGFENDPARSLRVARHIRWIQINHTCAQPEPMSGSVDAHLRRGSDKAAAVFEAIESADMAPWAAVSGDLIWINPGGLAVAVGAWITPHAAHRVMAPYIVDRTHQRRNHPVTGAALERRAHWCSLSLTAMRADGIEV